jgi:Icc protein
MRIALLSDAHFGPRATYDGKLRKLSDLAGPLTEQFVERMNREARPDLVVNLGDVVEDDNHDADLAAYRRFLELMSALEAPLLHVAGNHESVNLSDDELRALWNHTGPLYYSRETGGLHLTILRARHRRATEVTLSAVQLEWLRQDLAEANLPVLVFLHHPLSDMRLEGNRWFEREPHICLVKEREQARAILEQSGKVEAVFNGHVHWNHFDLVRQIPYITIQSLIENVEDDAPGRVARTHALIDVDPAHILVRVFGESPARYQLERRRPAS